MWCKCVFSLFVQEVKFNALSGLLKGDITRGVSDVKCFPAVRVEAMVMV